MTVPCPLNGERVRVRGENLGTSPKILMPAFPQFRALLVLGRISNLPTVWSNCLAAWLLNGGESWNIFYVLCAGATLLYIGGMFLNDAFDVGFDRQHRKERPIPSGQITVRAVWLIGGMLLLGGWLLLLSLGTTTALVALLLVGTIVLYDAVHKRTAFAPLLMALCRFLLYVVAGAATHRRLNDAVVWHGLALACYVTGLSFLARSESGSGLVRRWPLLLVLAPLGANALVNSNRQAMSWVASGVLCAWLVWCLRGLLRGAAQPIGKSVAGLLAGIVLVDWSAGPRLRGELAVAFVGLFALALVLQRKIPAT
jgi:hypothetical protein